MDQLPDGRLTRSHSRLTEHPVCAGHSIVQHYLWDILNNHRSPFRHELFSTAQDLFKQSRGKYKMNHLLELALLLGKEIYL